MERPLSKRGSGLLLALAVIAALGTIVQDYRFNQSIARDQSATVNLDRDLGALELAITDLRAAQAGYVAAGQEPDFWMSRATELATTLQASIRGLNEATVSADARQHYEAASTTLTELMAVDAKARDHVALGQHLFASDLIFMDGLEVERRLGEAVRTAREIEMETAVAGVTRLANLRLGMNALALGFVLVVMVYFARAGDAPQRAMTSITAPPPVEVDSSVVAPPAPMQVAPSAPPVLKAERAVSLSGAADLCVDLARLMDGRDLPALLERAARVLYAKGVVLWMADSDGAMLRPTVAHGYSDKVLARLGALQIDSDNVTALAYRTLQPQRIKSAEKGGTGAVAVPLISSTGGIGVLAAEMKSATPDDQMMAVARIVAAQLASLLAPAEADIKAAER